MKDFDIMPPQFSDKDQMHFDDLLFSLEWTLTTYTPMPNEMRTRLEDARDAYEQMIKDIKDIKQLSDRIGREW